MIVKILEFDKIYVHIHISMSVTRSNYTVHAVGAIVKVHVPETN